MLSISFLPWLLLLLGVVLSVPIVSYMENNRRKKAAEAAAAPPAEEEALEEEDEVGFGEEGEFGESYGSEEVIAAEGDLGQVEGDEFDEKAFK